MADDYDALLAALAAQHAGAIAANRLELMLWALVRGIQRAEARTRRHPVQTV